MRPTTKRVRAGEGRVLYFPREILAAPGRKPRRIAGDEVVVVPHCRFVRRRLQVGDLVEVPDDEIVEVAEVPVITSLTDTDEG